MAPSELLSPTANALTPEQLEVSAETVWKISGPPENFLTAVQRGYWALNDNNTGAWQAIQPGDIVVFHSIRKSLFVSNPPSSIIGFAKVGLHKFRKNDHWWLAEIADKVNHWPHAFAIEDACFATPSVGKFDFSTPFEDKPKTLQASEVAAALMDGIPMLDLENLAREIQPTTPHFPLTGSIARLSETYRRAIFSNRDWTPTRSVLADDDLELTLLSESERAELRTQPLDQILSAALTYKSPNGPSHKERLGRVRIEDAKQKYRIACLEDFTCQVCSYKQAYDGKKGIKRWIIHVDHIIQKADGGTEEIGNLWVLCPTCHAEKTFGIIEINPKTYDVLRLGKPVAIRDHHLKL